MKTKKSNAQNVCVFMASIIICLLFTPNSYSFTNEKEIALEGDWSTTLSDNIPERSLPTIPITAYLCGNYINIQNEKPDCDITIHLIDCHTGDIVCRQAIPQEATSNILIPISNLASGKYILGITGPAARHLEGYFSK